ncbi:MAG: hypothetical protein AAF358_07870 [Pseudomonadota bacterium]
MKFCLLTTIALFLILALPSTVEADDFYYRIGGAEPFSRPTVRPARNLRVGARFNAGVAYHCGNFDFDASLAAQMANARDRLRTGIVTSVQSLFAALPELLLQRIRPDLYDLFQKLMVRAEADVRFAFQSCDDWLEAGRESDGLGKLFREAVSVNWETEIDRNGEDIYQAQRNINDNPAGRGIRWCDGQFRAGSSGEALNPVSDSAIAGYNALLGRRCNDRSEPVSNEPSDEPGAAWAQLTQQFESPDDLEEFVHQALGDNAFQADTAAVGEGRVPQGLQGLLETAHYRDYNLIERAVFDDFAPHGPETYEPFYAGGSRLTPDLISALRQIEPGRRRVLSARFAREVAAARVVDQALQVLKSLAAARTIPELRSSDFVVSEIDRAMADLKRQIEELMFERRVRQSLVTDLAQMILAEADAITTRNTDQVPANVSPLRVEDGGVIDQR